MMREFLRMMCEPLGLEGGDRVADRMRETRSVVGDDDVERALGLVGGEGVAEGTVKRAMIQSLV